MNRDHGVQENCIYLKHCNLARNPFPVAPDDAHFYLSTTIEEIVAEIVHGVCARKGFIMLTGEVGLGKTTISRRIISILESRQVTTALVLHTTLQDIELLRTINLDFGIGEVAPDASIDTLMRRLNDFLLEQNRRGCNCAIVIDDAQNLNPRSLELVRMISNLETAQEKLVQIILVGQTELATVLNSHQLRQLCSRIVIRKMVRSLTAKELQKYIMFKLSAAGNQGKIEITQRAHRRIYSLTRGNFRSVNMLMDRCLYAIYVNDIHCITRAVVGMAWADIHQQESRKIRHAWALAASLLVPVALLLGSWAAHLHSARDSMAKQVEEISYKKVPEQLAAVNRSTVGRAAAPVQPLRSSYHGELPALDSAVTAFLSVYQLDAYAAAFQQALKDGRLESLAHRIYSEKGYQLISLESVPDKIRKRYGALAFSLSPGASPTWLLFWRPKLHLKRFYYSYQGEEIFTLQQRFAELQLYQYKLDGIVGPRLMEAVVTFQEQQGIPVTGFPDPVTLFWMCHLQEEIANG